MIVVIGGLQVVFECHGHGPVWMPCAAGGLAICFLPCLLLKFVNLRASAKTFLPKCMSQNTSFVNAVRYEKCVVTLPHAFQVGVWPLAGGGCSEQVGGGQQGRSLLLCVCFCACVCVWGSVFVCV